MAKVIKSKSKDIVGAESSSDTKTNSKKKFTFISMSNKHVSDKNCNEIQASATSSVAAAVMSDPIAADNLSPLTPSTSPTLTRKVRKRFATTTDEEINAIKENRFEENTVKNTTWGLKIFRDWLRENGIDVVFEFLTPCEIDKLLASFYVTVRRVNGEYYSKSAYICIRAAIQRHLQNPPYNVTFSILNDANFLHSNQLLKGIFKTLTEKGVSVVKHYKPIEKEDMMKLITTGVISTGNPRSLINLVWLLVALQFGKRGRENYRNMTQDTFIRGIDDSGLAYYEYRVCESQKNHSGSNLASTYMPQGRMYACPGDPLCPVAAMDLYMSHINPELDCLWQRPNKDFDKENSTWYCKIPLGKNTLDNMMKNMSKAADLSQEYTNHCTRATASKALGDASFDRSDIIKITGHRDTRSLDTYLGVASSSKKRALSDTLSNLTCQKDKHFKQREFTNQPSKNDNSNHESPTIFLDNNEQNTVFTCEALKPDNIVSETGIFDEDDAEFEMNMIKSAQEIDNRELKRPYVFNNCTFHNNYFK